MEKFLLMEGFLRRSASRFVIVFLFIPGVFFAPGFAGAQARFSKGQNIAPVFEGWKRNPDGSIVMYFGYLNRNYQEELDIPIGPNNNIEPGDDRGQPTHFLPRRHRFLFQVLLPKDWDRQRRVVWTITANDKTEQANGWLQPEWEVDDGVIQMNIGPGGVPPVDPPNTAPTISGSAAQTVTLPNTVTVTAKATDDGIPKPRPGIPPARGTQGLNIRWIHYRGPGKVTFSVPTSERVVGTPVEATTLASFSEPGIYVLRAIASDGLLETAFDVTVTVKDSTSR
jgi:hypothetical protein